MSYNVTRPNIWFFHTVSETSETGVPRLRMLSGQWVPDADSDGSYIPSDSTYNTESEMAPRSSHPIGTIFACKSVSIKSSSRGNKYYSTKGNKLISMLGGVSSDIEEAFKLYSDSISSVEKAPKKESKEKEISSESLIDKLLKANPIPTVEKDNFYVHEDVWTSLLFNMHQGYNTMLVGDSGTGKTELAMFLGKKMAKSVKVFDMAAKQDPIASLIGVHRFDGKSIFDRADFTYAIEQDGIIVLDELPRAPMNTNNILFPVLDSRRELNMDIASHELRTISVNPMCRFIATANEGYEYTGNNVIDRALKERFQTIMIDYMPNEQEVKLLRYRTGIAKSPAEVIIKVAKVIRDMRKKEDISSNVSIRHTLYAADLTGAGMAVSKAMEIAFLPMFTIEDERKKIKDLLSSR